MCSALQRTSDVWLSLTYPPLICASVGPDRYVLLNHAGLILHHDGTNSTHKEQDMVKMGEN